jgi:hypothetical protein
MSTPSRRRSPLPRGWARIRRRIIARDQVCQWTEDTTPHGGPLEVDHIAGDHNHSDDNLRALCHDHHATRTGRQGAAVANARRARRRPEDPHPGRVPETGGGR